MKKIFIIIIIIAGFAGYLLLTGDKSEQPKSDVFENQPAGDTTEKEDKEEGIVMTAEVIYTDSGFSPKELNVTKGTTVIFKNESSSNFWPASAMHPTHIVYPGSDIKKCGTSEENNIFDACKGILPGGSYSFIFDEIGKWGYHDHLRASNFGSIVVE